MSSTTFAQRIDGQRCAYCNNEVVDAWVCTSCSMGMQNNHYEEARWPTVTTISQQQQRRIDCGAAYAQHMFLVGLNDPGVFTIGEQSGYGDNSAKRSKAGRKLAQLTLPRGSYKKRHPITGRAFQAEGVSPDAGQRHWWAARDRRFSKK